MQITVRSSEGSAVRCETPTGELLVLWRGPVIPIAGDAVDVEMDAVGELTWATDAWPAGTTTGAGLDTLGGVLEHVDGGCAALRIGDSIVLLELTGEIPDAALGQPVRVRPQRWEAWPTGI